MLATHLCERRIALFGGGKPMSTAPVGSKQRTEGITRFE
jgi:hypothetical protein